MELKLDLRFHFGTQALTFKVMTLKTSLPKVHKR